MGDVAGERLEVFEVEHTAACVAGSCSVSEPQNWPALDVWLRVNVLKGNLTRSIVVSCASVEDEPSL
jgi:hypothetical protein